MNDFELPNWIPMAPALGPPLPRFLKIYWPWYKPPLPEPPEKGVLVGLLNPPSGATKWQMRVVDWDITKTISWGTKEQDNIRESAVFDIPPEWKFPLRIGLQIYKKINGSQQLYTVQSYRPYLWDFDINDWGTEPDPTYKEIFIPEYGSYYYNVATERFEKV